MGERRVRNAKAAGSIPAGVGAGRGSQGFFSSISSVGTTLRRIVVRSTTGPDFIVFAADFIEKNELKIGSRVALNKQSLSVISVLPGSKDTLVANAEVMDKPDVTYDDIGGLEDQILEMKETVEFPLTKPEFFREVIENVGIGEIAATANARTDATLTIFAALDDGRAHALGNGAEASGKLSFVSCDADGLRLLERATAAASPAI